VAGEKKKAESLGFSLHIKKYNYPSNKEHSHRLCIEEREGSMRVRVRRDQGIIPVEPNLIGKAGRRKSFGRPAQWER